MWFSALNALCPAFLAAPGENAPVVATVQVPSSMQAGSAHFEWSAAPGFAHQATYRQVSATATPLELLLVLGAAAAAAASVVAALGSFALAVNGC